MKLKWITGALAAGLLVCGASGPLNAQDPQAPAKTQPTADQAKNNTTDRDLMQKIRQSIMDDKSLSTSAHNVKVIAKDGKVTLKGQVPSDAEKQTVESKATEIAGSGNVTNQITVKAARAKKTNQ